MNLNRAAICGLVALTALATSRPCFGVYPIALDYHHGSNLYALNSDGTVVEIGMQNSNHGVTIAKMSSQSNGRPVDIVAYDAWNGGNVASSELTGNNTVFRIWDAKRRELLSQQTVKKPCAGFDVDVARQQIYAASSISNEIVGVDLRTRQTSVVARIEGAQSLGPLVIGVSVKSIFTADQRTGQVFQIELNTQRTQHIVGTVSQPVAMTFDETNQVLYVADASLGVIYRFPFGKTRNFPQIETGVRELSGLAIGPNGTVFVSSTKFSHIEQISDKGILLETFPPFSDPHRLNAINATKRLIESLTNEQIATITMQRIVQEYRDEEVLQKKHNLNPQAPLPEPLKSRFSNMAAAAPKVDFSDLTQIENALRIMQDPQAQKVLKNLESFGTPPKSPNFYPPQTVGDLDEFSQGRFLTLQMYVSQAQYILRTAD